MTHERDKPNTPSTQDTRASTDTETGSARKWSLDSIPTPTNVGPYKVLELIDEGGMGSVYLAQQSEPVRRRVALKIIKLGMDTKEVLARFEVERQALAMMDHPNIAIVLDAGSTDEGRPFFAMEYVPGESITEYCDKQKLDVRDRLKLFMQVCLGVQHAHQKGIIHRDIKPSNILVQVRDGEPVPKIIDFGLAKATNQRLTERTLFTQRGRILGTPEYMSPEQAEMTGVDVDTRTDVYSLGVLLYEMIVGHLPFSSKELRGATHSEIQRTIREVDPPKPSTRVTNLDDRYATIAGKRRTDRTGLLRLVRGDLDWITMKALEKDPNRRYQTALGLMEDVRCHLDDEPVMASPPSQWYRLSKYVRRNRTKVAAAAAVLLALIGGTIGTAVGLVRADRERALAKESLDKFNLLANEIKLRDARTAASALYPAWPDQAESMRSWLFEQARPLEQTVEQVASALTELQKRGEVVATAASVATDTAGNRTANRRPRPFLADETTRQSHRFAKPADQFLHDWLERLLAKLRDFAGNSRGELAAVRRRLGWARQIETLTHHHPRATVSWDDARQAIRKADGIVASELYRQHPVELTPQIGLVPIGMNPKTRLWEFYHLRSAWHPAAIPSPANLEIPGHRTDGSIDVREDPGIVFVLVPGGTFTMGGQSDDAQEPHYDPLAEDDESPPSEVTLAPFFLAKYELTQGQWRRLSGGDEPSSYQAGQKWYGRVIDATHPVEQVSWHECDRLLWQQGLNLPTEAQWEFACRAGTASPWSTGGNVSTLQDHANVADQSARDAGADWTLETSLDDGNVLHARVGSFEPNAFGLFDTHGNVYEWCRDAEGDYFNDVAPGDGLRLETDTEKRIYRGGGFSTPARFARSASRSSFAPGQTREYVGVRAARAVR